MTDLCNTGTISAGRQLTLNSQALVPVAANPIVEREVSICGRSLTEDHDSVFPERVRACIIENNWSLNYPNRSGYQQVPSAEEYIDLLARMYLAHEKKRDKFMPTEARIREYQYQLETGDKHQRDSNWRFYTKKTFEYFPTPIKHEISNKVVFGLYKHLSIDDQHAFKLARENNLLEPASRDLKWEEYGSMAKHEKAFFTQAPVTSLEDSYNIILEAHVKLTQNLGRDIHYGRDSTFRRISAISCSITKDVVFQFVKHCPGCAPRNNICSRARARAVKTQRQRQLTNGGIEPNGIDQIVDADHGFPSNESQQATRSQVGHTQNISNNPNSFGGYKSYYDYQTPRTLTGNDGQSSLNDNLSSHGDQNIQQPASTHLANDQYVGYNVTPEPHDFGASSIWPVIHQYIDPALLQLHNSGTSHSQQVTGNPALNGQQYIPDPNSVLDPRFQAVQPMTSVQALNSQVYSNWPEQEASMQTINDEMNNISHGMNNNPKLNPQPDANGHSEMYSLLQSYIRGDQNETDVPANGEWRLSEDSLDSISSDKISTNSQANRSGATEQEFLQQHSFSDQENANHQSNIIDGEANPGLDTFQSGHGLVDFWYHLPRAIHY